LAVYLRAELVKLIPLALPEDEAQVEVEQGGDG